MQTGFDNLEGVHLEPRRKLGLVESWREEGSGSLTLDFDCLMEGLQSRQSWSECPGMGQEAMACGAAKKIPKRCKKTPRIVVKCWHRAPEQRWGLHPWG